MWILSGWNDADISNFTMNFSLADQAKIDDWNFHIDLSRILLFFLVLQKAWFLRNCPLFASCLNPNIYIFFKKKKWYPSKEIPSIKIPTEASSSIVIGYKSEKSTKEKSMKTQKMTQKEAETEVFLVFFFFSKDSPKWSVYGV